MELRIRLTIPISQRHTGGQLGDAIVNARETWLVVLGEIVDKGCSCDARKG